MRALRRLHPRTGPRYFLCISEGNRDAYHQMVAEGGPWDYLDDLLLCLVRPGDLVLDLGANIGVLTMPLAAAGARVVAYEPHPENLPFLEAAVRLNGFADRVTVRKVAAWDGAGRLRLDQESAWARVDPSGPIAVDSVAIDDDLPADAEVRLVKIDIEGSEVRALQGMRRMLARCRPHIAFESNTKDLGHLGTSAAELQRFLVDLDYRIYRLFHRRRLLAPGRIPQELAVIECLATVAPPRWLRAAGLKVGRMRGRHIIRVVRRLGPDRIADCIHLAVVADRLPRRCRRDPAVTAVVEIGRSYGDHPFAESIRRGAAI